MSLFPGAWMGMAPNGSLRKASDSSLDMLWAWLALECNLAGLEPNHSFSHWGYGQMCSFLSSWVHRTTYRLWLREVGVRFEDFFCIHRWTEFGQPSCRGVDSISPGKSLDWLAYGWEGLEVGHNPLVVCHPRHGGTWLIPGHLLDSSQILLHLSSQWNGALSESLPGTAVGKSATWVCTSFLKNSLFWS